MKTPFEKEPHFENDRETSFYINVGYNEVTMI